MAICFAIVTIGLTIITVENWISFLRLPSHEYEHVYVHVVDDSDISEHNHH